MHPNKLFGRLASGFGLGKNTFSTSGILLKIQLLERTLHRIDGMTFKDLK